MKDGWHKQNPKNVVCEDCGNPYVEFLWQDGEVKGFRCDVCGETILDK